MQWLVRAHFYWQLERSLCLGNQIIISAGFSISSAEKWVCDQNAHYVIRLEDEIPLFQSCRPASGDETQSGNGHCQGLLPSSLPSVIWDPGEVPPLCTAIASPMTPQGWIGLSLGSLVEGSQEAYRQACGNLLLWKTSIWSGCWGAEWGEEAASWLLVTSFDFFENCLERERGRERE